MGIANTERSWGWPARLLHWLMALLIVGMLVFGFYLTTAYNDGDPTKLGLVQTHKSVGFVVFALACLRIIWRAANPSPALPAGMSSLERMGAKLGHLALYGLMFAIPLSGWLGASASPYNDADAYPMQIKDMVFGLFEMPDPYPSGSHEVSDWWMQIHLWLALTLLVVLALHVAAALKHALINRDGVFGRMVSGKPVGDQARPG